MNPLLTCAQRQWLHSSVGRASHLYREVSGSNPVEVLNFFQASLGNCINCVHCDDDVSSQGPRYRFLFVSGLCVVFFFMDSYYENKSFLWKSGRKITFLRTPSPVHTYEQAFRCRKYRYHDQPLEFSTYISRNDLNIFSLMSRLLKDVDIVFVWEPNQI